MALLSKLRCITVDVTGTLMAYKGELGDYYCMAAKSVGLPCPDYKRVHEGFKLAYSEMAKKYPCFGHAVKMPNIVWWKTCVRDSFERGSEWDFGVFSGLVGVEKPNPKIYEIALERAGNIAPQEALHIGDSMRKDYLPAKSLGMHALLLDRFKTPDAENWRKSGAPVFPDLTAVQELLNSDSLTC
ncbi:hypothetical protein Ancab_021849 [Ancistrocladus abbreviatus]